MKGNYDLEAVSKKITACEIRHFPGQNIKALNYSLLPLTKIHLYGNGIKFLETTGNIKYVEIFSVIAVIILLIACINYMNLSTALSLKRAKEVGIKKAIGADRKTLMGQFFGESLFLSLIALIIAIVLVELFLPAFNQLAGKHLIIRYDDMSFLPMVIGVAFLTSLVSWPRSSDISLFFPADSNVKRETKSKFK